MARGQPMMTKQFASETGGALRFDYSALPMREKQARLSQLSLWVVEAGARAPPYSLSLPGPRSRCRSAKPIITLPAGARLFP